MNAAADAHDEVQILPPDQSLKKKLGNADLDTLLSPQVIATAQQVIVKSSDQFLDESQQELERLEQLAKQLTAATTDVTQLLENLIATAFALKAKAGLAGYDLIGTIAKSLHLRCEALEKASLTPTNRAIITWHIDSMRKLLTMKVKGSGGIAGAAVIAELDRLAKTTGVPQ